MIGIEVIIVTVCALFFTLLYKISEAKLWGIFSYGCWQTLTLLWLVLVAEPMEGSSNVYGTYGVAFLWQGIGIVMLMSVIIQWLSDLRFKKLHGNKDDWELPD